MADVLDAGGLSKQQFRWKIFESLRESGVTDRLKSQLRAHIVNEIRVSTNGNLPTTSTPKSLHLSRKRNQSSGTNGIVEIEGTGETDELLNEADPAKPQPGTLMTRVVDSLIIDYLRMKGSEFTLSVFMPECGLTRASQMFAEEDIFRALHLDHDTTLLRMLRKNLHSMPSTAILVRVLGSLSKIGNVNVMEREAQTDIDDAEYLEMQIRKADRDNTFQNRESNRMMAKSIEERMQRYQSDLEARMKLELEQQLAKFKEIEVASMRVEERQKFAIEITHVKGDYEARMLQQRERLAESNDDIRRKLDAREKEIERGNLEFRQRLLDEGNRNLMTERNLRSEAELAAKSLTLERDSLQRRLDEARSEIGELHGFKDRYTAKMQEAMSQYKIDLNKEHAGILQAAQVERAKIETEKLVLDEKIKAVEQMMQQTRDSQHEMEELRLNLKETRVQLDETIREREDALHEVRELKLQVSSHKTSTALEFEIQSLKIQLVDAEKMAIKRQEDYQSLLKSLMGPKEETQKELLKARKGEQKWQRQCSELVAKLDIEMNRADEWQRKYDDEVVRCKELLREISDLRNVLHQTRAAMGVDQQHLGDALKSLGGPRSTLPDPYNAIDPAPHRIPHQTLPDPRYSPQPFHSPHLRPVPQPYQYSPNRSITPDVRPPIRFNDAWTQGYDRMYAGLDPPHLDRLLSESHETKRYDATHWDWVPRDHPAPTAPQPQDMLPPVEGVGSGFADDVMQSFSSDVKSPPTKSKAAQAASTVLAPRSQLPVPSSSSSPIPERRTPKPTATDPKPEKKVQPKPEKKVDPKPERTPVKVDTKPEQSRSQGALKESPTTSLEDEMSRGSVNAPPMRLHGIEEDVKSNRTDTSTRSKPSTVEPKKVEIDDSSSSRRQHQTHQQRETEVRERMRRLEEERERRDRERRDRERAELDRIRREREEMARKMEEEEERRQRIEEERVEREKVEMARREEEERLERERREVEEGERRKEEEKMRRIEELEQDPTMKKYMDIVKERREKEAQQTKSLDAPSRARFGEALNTPSERMSRNSSFNFGGGDTADEISGGHTADHDSDPW